MSSKNKHWNSGWAADIDFKKCRKRGCTGTMISCEVTYKPGGAVHNELECSTCSNILKDPKYSNRFRNLFRQTKPRYHDSRGPARSHDPRNR